MAATPSSDDIIEFSEDQENRSPVQQSIDQAAERLDFDQTEASRSEQTKASPECVNSSHSSDDQHSVYSLQQRRLQRQRSGKSDRNQDHRSQSPKPESIKFNTSDDARFDHDIEEIRKQVRSKRKRRSTKNPLRREPSEDMLKNNKDRLNVKAKPNKKSKSADLNDYIMQLFKSQNVANDDRLSLGIFNKGRSAKTVKRSGVGDLVFSETKFLGKDGGDSESDTSEFRKRDRKSRTIAKRKATDDDKPRTDTGWKGSQDTLPTTQELGSSDNSDDQWRTRRSKRCRRDGNVPQVSKERRTRLPRTKSTPELAHNESGDFAETDWCPLKPAKNGSTSAHFTQTFVGSKDPTHVDDISNHETCCDRLSSKLVGPGEGYVHTVSHDMLNQPPLYGHASDGHHLHVPSHSRSPSNAFGNSGPETWTWNPADQSLAKGIDDPNRSPSNNWREPSIFQLPTTANSMPNGYGIHPGDENDRDLGSLEVYNSVPYVPSYNDYQCEQSNAQSIHSLWKPQVRGEREYHYDPLDGHFANGADMRLPQREPSRFQRSHQADRFEGGMTANFQRLERTMTYPTDYQNVSTSPGDQVWNYDTSSHIPGMQLLVEDDQVQDTPALMAVDLRRSRACYQRPHRRF